MAILLTFDVEEYFQVENLRKVFPRTAWNSQVSTVEKNVDRLLEILNQYNISATFFILGMVAAKHPGLVKKIMDMGHEVASHGYGHEITYRLTEKELAEDIETSKKILEDLCGCPIIGYRAPNFSISDRVLRILKKLDFNYDSSYNPFQVHARYGNINMGFKEDCRGIWNVENGLIEVPVASVTWAERVFPNGGGAYFRIIPLELYKRLAKKTLEQKSYFNMYLHPWEFEPEQPRVSGISLNHRLRHYWGLKNTYKKFDELIQFFYGNHNNFYTMSQFLDRERIK